MKIKTIVEKSSKVDKSHLLKKSPSVILHYNLKQL